LLAVICRDGDHERKRVKLLLQVAAGGSVSGHVSGIQPFPGLTLSLEATFPLSTIRHRQHAVICLKQRLSMQRDALQAYASIKIAED
jgi:hypothetical protein